MPPRSLITSHSRLRAVAGSLSGAWKRPGSPMSLPASPLVSRRWSSTEPSQYNAFFKTFGRPIFKVSLMAIFTYQLVFFGWTKLFQDDVRAEREATIESLEAQIKELQATKKTT